MTIALIDTDVLVYNSAFGAQKTVYYHTPEGSSKEVLYKDFESFRDWCKAQDPEIKTKDEKGAGRVRSEVQVLPENIALLLADKNLNAVIDAVKADTILMYISGESNFRDEVGVTKKYKGNRDNAVKPVHYEAVKAFFLANPNTLVSDGCEADDLIAIDQYTKYDNEAVVCTIDKDLNQIAGKHYDWNKKIKYIVGEDDALYFFNRQLLIGDSTDNIPGVRGIGEKGAIKLLEEHRNNPEGGWKAVQEIYSEKGYDKKYLEEQMQLLWMQRKPDERITIDSYEQEYLK